MYTVYGKMAESSDTVNRVKQLLSPFLSKFGQCSSTNVHVRTDKSQASESFSGMDTSDTKDKKLFLERVETFSPITWFAKPVDLSPLACAMYGWKNIEKDILQCVTCKVFLCGQLPKPVDAVVYRDSCRKLKNSLVESHDKLCKWPLNPFPESYLSIQCHDREELLKDFHQRVMSLQLCKIPKLTYKTVEDQGMTEDILWSIVQKIKEFESCKDLPSVVDICALCGWTSSESQKEILKCEYCQRKIGMWNFSSDTDGDEDNIDRNECFNVTSIVKSVVLDKSDKTSDMDDKTEEKITDKDSTGEDKLSTGNKDINNCDKLYVNGLDNQQVDDQQVEPKRKKQKLMKHKFDPVAEHRYWCPWLQIRQTSVYSQNKSSACSPLKVPPDNIDISPVKDSGESSSDPAWLQATKVLGHVGERDFREQMKQSPQSEGLRYLRKVLQQCTSPESQRKFLNT